MTDRGDDPIEWTATELAMAAARGDRAALDEIIHRAAVHRSNNTSHQPRSPYP